MQIVGQTWLSLVTLTCGPWNEGQHDLYFTVQWFCLISCRLFHVCTSYFGIMNQYDPSFDLKINVGHCDLYFMVQWFCLVSWRLFDVWTSLFGIMSQYDLKFDLKINIGHCDLYFMVQWFCVISWSLFDVCTSCFGIMGQYDLTFDLKISVGLVWPIILSYISKTIWCMSVIYGPAILLYILKTSWWRNVIMDLCDSKINLLKYMLVSDLYFMVHWFCLISCHRLKIIFNFIH